MSDAAPPQPYLSVVLASRNGSDGELRRLRLGLGRWLALAERHGVPEEILVVEWNPPSDRLRLAACLRGEAKGNRLRVVSVSAEVHAALAPAGGEALLEHRALNVGLRRARGRFALLTRAGVAPSDALVRFLAGRTLASDTLYRCDSWEIGDDGAQAPEAFAPEMAPPLRLFRRRETFDLTTGRVKLAYQRPLAVWWEPINPILNFSIFLLDALVDLGRAIRDRLRAQGGDQRASYRREGWRVLRRLACAPATILAKGAYLFRARRGARTYFVPLHLNACGDFLLLDSARWRDVRGLPEYQGASANVDVAFMLALLGAGRAREKVLGWPRRLFRLAGADPAPPAHGAASRLDFFAAARMADGWRVQGATLTFNEADWGLADLMLAEG